MAESVAHKAVGENEDGAKAATRKRMATSRWIFNFPSAAPQNLQRKRKHKIHLKSERLVLQTENQEEETLTWSAPLRYKTLPSVSKTKPYNASELPRNILVNYKNEKNDPIRLTFSFSTIR